MPAEKAEREGVPLTNLDQELFEGSGATKRDLIDYLDAMSAQDLITSWATDDDLSAAS